MLRRSRMNERASTVLKPCTPVRRSTPPGGLLHHGADSVNTIGIAYEPTLLLFDEKSDE